jgi:phage terminase large subunit
MDALAELEAYVAGLSDGQKAELDKMLAPELTSVQNVNLLERLRRWEPRPYQLPSWQYLENGGKRACLIWHRRSGKDDVALNWAARAAHERVGEYWHMLPEAAQGRKAIWDAVSPHTGRRRVDQAFPFDLRDKTREDEMVIRFKNGSLWRVVGSDNYESLLGSTPAGVVFSEWALADPNAWAFLRPILMENNGWAMFITTPRGANHARKTLDLAKSDPVWFAEVLSVKETGVFTSEQLASELREYQHDYGMEEGAALFDQEYNCSFESALIGSYYGSYLTRATKEGRIGSVPIDRAALVHTAWDLGVSDSTSIWFIQCVGKERHLVDYHEGAGVGLDEYARVLQERQNKHGWIYGQHYFPHDVEVRELGNRGLSRSDTLAGLGIKPSVVAQHSLMDGVNAVRRMLDSTWIDEVRCERGLNALRNYRRMWDDKLKTFRDSPLHDWASHGADALRSFASGFREHQDDKLDLPAPLEPLSHGSAQGWMTR